MRLFRQPVLWSIIFVLIGCASPPPEPDLPEGWVVQRKQLLNFNQWDVKAKLAYKKQNDSLSANLVWQESSEQSTLRLFNPLGVTLVEMSVSPDVATLIADNQTHQDTNIEALLHRVTGWNIPVRHLRSWVKGLPDEKDMVTFYPNGTIKAITPQCSECAKWRIEYSRYMQVNDLILPAQLTVYDMTHDKTYIKLRISEWR